METMNQENYGGHPLCAGCNVKEPWEHRCISHCCCEKCACKICGSQVEYGSSPGFNENGGHVCNSCWDLYYRA